MGIKRIVDSGFWKDTKVEDFSPEDKYFMLYLLTNPLTTQLGIYEFSVKQSAFWLGYSTDSVRVLLERFENKYDVIKYSKDTNEVAIKNYLRHSIMKGGAPVRDCIVKEMKSVKNKSLIEWVFSNIKECENLNPTVKSIIEEYEEKNGAIKYHNEKDNENDNDNENEVTYHVTSTLRPIVDYLNKKADAKYRYTTKKTKDCIQARLNEGFTQKDFEIVIDKKCNEWIGTEWEKYLRPETLFGPKFESYLNAKVTKKPVNTGIAQNVQDPLAGMFK